MFFLRFGRVFFTLFAVLDRAGVLPEVLFRGQVPSIALRLQEPNLGLAGSPGGVWGSREGAGVVPRGSYEMAVHFLVSPFP